MNNIFNLRIQLSTALLVILGTVDLLSTLAWLQLGGAEGNPIFRAILSYGTPSFVLAKVAFLAGPIAILEFARTKSPHTAEAGTWIAFLAYLGLWTSQLYRLGQALPH